MTKPNLRRVRYLTGALAAIAAICVLIVPPMVSTAQTQNNAKPAAQRANQDSTTAACRRGDSEGRSAGIALRVANAQPF